MTDGAEMRIPCCCILLMSIVGIVRAEEAPRLPFNPESVPEAPAEEGAFRFVVLADMNGPYGSTTYNQHVHGAIELIVARLSPTFAFSAGDLVAGQRRGFTDEQLWAMWAGFEEAVTAPLREAGIPFIPCAGNHDASGYPAFEREREIYVENWRKPENRPDVQFIDDTHYPLYYTFTQEDAFFMVLDVTTVDPLPEDHWPWIEQQLEQAQDYALRFATAHVPPYPVTHGREHEIIPPPDNDRLRELMTRYNMTAFFTGHHHGYFKGRKEGLNLISLNACGDGPRPLIGTDQPQLQSFLVVDVADGQVQQVFAIHADGSIFQDETLPEKLVHEQYTLPRFDQ
jgi:hypothetical protein